MFEEVGLFLTNLCNSNCRVCNFWKNSEGAHLSFNVVERCLEEYSEKSLFIFGGGEPFLWDSIEALDNLLANEYPYLNYIVLSNLKLVDKVSASHFKRFTVSWDGVKSDYIRYNGCSNNLIKFLDNKREKKVRIAYTVSRYNIEEFLWQDSKMLHQLELEYNLQHPYILIETDLSYFYRKNAEEKFGFNWLLEKLSSKSLEKAEFIAALERANARSYTIAALSDLENMNSIICQNPVNSLQISWDGKIRFCPGIRWDEELFTANDYFSNVRYNELELKHKLFSCYRCQDILRCGVGCRYHVDASKYFSILKK